MAGEQDERDVHQAVVEQDRAGEAEAGVALPVPEQEARDGEQNDEGAGHRGVELLSGVEFSRPARAVAKPAAVVLIEAVELAQGREKAPSGADGDDEGEREQPCDTCVEGGAS
jgi:hypothetical protein